LLPAIRYEVFDPSNYDSANGTDESWQQINANITMLGAANIKMMLEGSFKIDDADSTNDHKVRLSFNWTF
jgi:hypothetical protein